MPPYTIEPLDRVFRANSREVERLWDSGTEHYACSDSYNHLRVSECGKWVIKNFDINEDRSCPELNPDRRTRVARSEIRRLRVLHGVHVISHAMLASLSGKNLFVLSPYLSNMDICPPGAFEELQKQVDRYYDAKTPEEYAMRELRTWDQYSSIETEHGVVPFLHDIDPRVTKYQNDVYGVFSF